MGRCPPTVKCGLETTTRRNLYPQLYTDDAIDIQPGQIIRDTFDGQQYTVTTELAHNTIHPMVRYIVEGVVKK